MLGTYINLTYSALDSNWAWGSKMRDPGNEVATIFFQIKYFTVGDEEYANFCRKNYIRSWRIIPRLLYYRIVRYLTSKF